MISPAILEPGIRSRTSLPARSPATAHVLVVDDDPTIADVVTILLREGGFAVEKMTDSTEALARLAAEPARFAALVTDHDMPGIKGSELIDRARAAGFRGKVIIHSGSTGSDDAEKLRRADVLLEKPLGIRSLIPALRTLVAR